MILWNGNSLILYNFYKKNRAQCKLSQNYPLYEENPAFTGG